MIHDLKLALAINARFNEPKLVVSENVLREVLSRVAASGDGHARMNIEQDSLNYRFMHKVVWRGIVFVHLSREALSEPSISAVDPR